MKSRYIQFIPALLALIAVAFADFSQWCAGIDHECYRTIVDRMIPDVTYPAYYFALYFLPMAIMLIFIRRDIFVWWAKFSVLLFIFAFLFIATTPVSSPGFLNTVTRDGSAQDAAILVDLASVIFIIIKYRQARKIRTS